MVVSSLAISYLQAKQTIREDFLIQQDNTANNARESVWMVNTGLLLIDKNLNPQMERSLDTFQQAYVQAGNNPAAIDLPQVRDEIATGYTGDLNLYIIDADGIIRYSTLPEVRGVDFRNYPDFYRELTRIRLGSSFSADPVVRSVENADDVNVNGTLRKFAYIPSPDHQYVLEIGLDSPGFSDVRSELSYQKMADRLFAVNPDLEGIRVWDFYGNAAASAGSPGSNSREMVLMAIANRSSLTSSDPAGNEETRFIFVDLRDPEAVSDASVVVELRFSNERLNATLADLVNRFLIIGISAIVMGLLLAFFLFRKLTGSIGAIVEDVGIVAGGDLAHTIRSVNTAEFAVLESGINTMIKKILLYSEELERKKAELQVAADIQQAFLPKNLPDIPGYDLAAMSLPAREVGGDFYDVFLVRDGNHALVIADVSGKGVPASLFMALSRTAVRIVSRWERSARQVLEGSNTIFMEDSGSVSFVTAFYGILDSRQETFQYVNAGHNPPLLLHADGSLEELEPTGPVIGLVDEPGYEEREVRLRSGDVLVMYTDGVTEAIDSGEKMFGDDRLKEVIRRSAGLPASGMVAAIRTAVTTFCGDAPQFDDMTILVVKVR
ncbi:MAG: SpoIIE family protein phosphatase [Methanomicrobiales archaeon]|nr:SpoIIE family protein phosphatase [Methanomicrobiales archaeon]